MNVIKVVDFNIYVIVTQIFILSHFRCNIKINV